MSDTKQEVTVVPKAEVAEATGVLSVETLIAQAIDKNVSVETMERLFALFKEVKAGQAKEAFDTAMSKFQMECPVIVKDKQVKDSSGRILYSYAPLESIVTQTKEYLAKNGFSYAIQTEMPEGHVKVICTVKHKMGHSETTDVVMPLSTKTGIMSAPQQTAATLTFGKRYAFCNAFGIMTGDEDTDAVEEKQPVDVETHRHSLMTTKNMDELKKVWASLPAQAKKELEPLKQSLKTQYENA